jgi:hypothetical protein
MSFVCSRSIRVECLVVDGETSRMIPRSERSTKCWFKGVNPCNWALTKVSVGIQWYQNLAGCTVRLAIGRYERLVITTGRWRHTDRLALLMEYVTQEENT